MIVSELWIYPIKSCQGIRVSQRQMLKTGLQGDRNWMLVDENGEFLTQREFPILATVKTGEDSQGFFVARDLAKIRLQGASDRIVSTAVWGAGVQASVEKNAEVSDFFCELLKKKVSLVTHGKSFERQTSGKDGSDQSPVYFADGYPLTLTSETSLADLNSRLNERIPMTRFRPNLVVSGAATAFEEDRWGQVQIGQLQIKMKKLCARCVITTLDQTTGMKKSAEPLKTLAKYRKQGAGIYFAVNAWSENEGLIREGDSFQVLNHRTG